MGWGEVLSPLHNFPTLPSVGAGGGTFLSIILVLPISLSLLWICWFTSSTEDIRSGSAPWKLIRWDLISGKVAESSPHASGHTTFFPKQCCQRNLKGTVSVMSRHTPFMQRFTTLPLKPISDQACGRYYWFSRVEMRNCHFCRKDIIEHNQFSNL